MEFVIIAVIFTVIFGHYAFFVKEETGKWPDFQFFFGE